MSTCTPGRNINERAAGPDRAVERRKFIVGGGNDGPEIFLEQFGIILERGIRVGKDDALVGQGFFDAVINHFTFVLRANARQKLLFRLWNAQLVERVFDVFAGPRPSCAPVFRMRERNNKCRQS